MTIVSQLLQGKGTDIWSIKPEAKVYEALQMMADKNVGALVVLENEKLVGIISERDYARKVILHEKSSMQIPVSEIMTHTVFCVSRETSIEECMALMTDKRVRHLPVVEGGRIVGIVSIGDAVKAMVAQQQFIIEQLENYISS